MSEPTYVTQSDASSYFSGRLNSDSWDNASDDDQYKALVTATRIMEQLNWNGEISIDGQDLQFPRDGDLTIPTNIQYACAELALSLLDGKDVDKEIDNTRLTGVSFGTVRAGYNENMPEHIMAGIPSIVAWRLLKPYLRDSQTIVLTRVS